VDYRFPILSEASRVLPCGSPVDDVLRVQVLHAPGHIEGHPEGHGERGGLLQRAQVLADGAPRKKLAHQAVEGGLLASTIELDTRRRQG
jgi:hypothetical protein